MGMRSFKEIREKLEKDELFRARLITETAQVLAEHGIPVGTKKDAGKLRIASGAGSTVAAFAIYDSVKHWVTIA